MSYQINYRCQDCGKEFPAVQGSRRRYCDNCMLKRIKSGKKQLKKGAKHGM